MVQDEQLKFWKGVGIVLVTAFIVVALWLGYHGFGP